MAAGRVAFPAELLARCCGSMHLVLVFENGNRFCAMDSGAEQWFVCGMVHMTKGRLELAHMKKSEDLSGSGACGNTQ